MKHMTGFTGVLAGLSTVLVVLLAFLGTMNVHVAVAPVDEAFGAVAVLNSPLEVNGTTEIRQGQALNSGTSTICSLKTPNATTTGDVYVKVVSRPFAMTVQIANATTQTATTTDLGSFTDGDGVSTPGSIYAPNTYLNVKVATSSGTTVNANFAPTGHCSFDLWQL